MTSHVRPLPSTTPGWTRHTDVVVVGCGAAGLSAALRANALGLRVLIIAKSHVDGGSTPLAQGGLAAVIDPRDSFALHLADTLVAGAGLVDEVAARDLVAAAPSVIARLQGLGGNFDSEHLGLEGGHSMRRIVHAGGDASGAEVHRVLLRAVTDAGIEIMQHAVALDALLGDSHQVAGLVVGKVHHDRRRTLDVGQILAGAVVLATGGFGQAYDTTTNPAESTGDGVALAARAGAEIVDIEFVQFHPTVVYQAGRRGQCPLISEAVRGAGATIIDSRGRPVMNGRHPLGDLAPRDVVSALMYEEMTTGDGPSTNLWLDVRPIGSTRINEEFPTLAVTCRSLSLDPSRDPIPIAPGAHYACGGVRADMDGTTSLAGLYAVGEVAATGVHGANRLASNSLTEAIITGDRLGRLLGQFGAEPAGQPSPPAVRPGSVGVDSTVRPRLVRAMSTYAGVLRDESSLERLLATLASAEAASTAHVDLDVVEATNIHTVATLVANAALAREESRGSHRRSDFPQPQQHHEERITLRITDNELTIKVPVSQ